MEFKIYEGRLPLFSQRDKGLCWHKYPLNLPSSGDVVRYDLLVNGVQIHPVVQVEKDCIQVFPFIKDSWEPFQGCICRRKKLEELLPELADQFLFQDERNPACPDFENTLRDPGDYVIGSCEGVGDRRFFQIYGLSGQSWDERPSILIPKFKKMKWRMWRLLLKWNVNTGLVRGWGYGINSKIGEKKVTFPFTTPEEAAQWALTMLRINGGL